MKKIVILAFVALVILACSLVRTGHARRVELASCIDGDTARFIIDGEEDKYRFLLIDTFEKDERYGKESSDFTCSALQKAQTIELEYQDGQDRTDRYDRQLVWVFVDGELLQTLIAKAGYVKKYYDNGGPYDYKYEIEQADREAQIQHRGQYQ